MNEMKVFQVCEHSKSRFALVSRAILGVFLLVLFATSMSRTAAAAIGFVQVNSAVPTSVSTITAAYSKAQTAGDMNIVVIGWDSTSNTVKSVADGKGNSYKLAVTYTS